MTIKQFFQTAMISVCNVSGGFAWTHELDSANQVRVRPLGVVDDIPRQIRRQQWSIFNVWLIGPQLKVCKIARCWNGCQPLRTSCLVSTLVAKRWEGETLCRWVGTHFTTHSSPWACCRARICRSGFNSQRSHSPEGAHSGRVQERILNMVVATDA